MNKILKNRIIIIIILIVSASLIYENITFVRLNEEYKVSYYETVQNRIDHSNDLVLANYQAFSRFVYQETVNGTIAVLMAEANTADSGRKEAIRDQLIEEYSVLYEHIDAINFRQYHFHLLGGESFIRFHSIEKYGDDLTGIRDTVTKAQEEGVFVQGFEEGKIFNGYRFVYPIFYEGAVVGTMEASVSYRTVNAMTKQFSNYHSLFLIDQEVVLSNLFENELDNYIKINEFSEFFVEVISDDLESLSAALQIDESKISRINRLINESIESGTYLDVEANIHELDDRTLFTVISPVENIHGEILAYNVYYGDEPIYHHMRKTHRHTLILVYILNIMVLIAIIVITYFFIRTREISFRDKLTDLYNRTYFDKKVMSAIIDNDTTSVIMMDIDDFKQINDTYGHNEGDRVLKTLSRIIEKNIRVTDVPFRWGGDEFTVVLIGSNETQAVRIAERIRKAIEVAVFDKYTVTASFGVTEYKQGEEIINLFKRVDENLYKAKSEGKNMMVSTNGGRKV